MRIGGLGHKLTRAFARKLGAVLAISGEGGTTLTLKLPDTAAGYPTACTAGQHSSVGTRDRWRPSAPPY